MGDTYVNIRQMLSIYDILIVKLFKWLFKCLTSTGNKAKRMVIDMMNWKFNITWHCILQRKASGWNGPVIVSKIKIHLSDAYTHFIHWRIAIVSRYVTSHAMIYTYKRIVQLTHHILFYSKIHEGNKESTQYAPHVGPVALSHKYLVPKLGILVVLGIQWNLSITTT